MAIPLPTPLAPSAPWDHTRPGVVRCWFHPSPAAAVRDLTDRADRDGDDVRTVLHPCVPRGTPEEILQHLVDALAEAAATAWPDWYDGRVDLDAAPPAAHGIRGSDDGIDPRWLIAAIRACRSARLPAMPQRSAVQQCDQLSRALGAQLRIALWVADDTAATTDDADALGFARAAERLARATRAHVLAVLPERWRTARALDPITSGYLHTPAAPAPGPARSPTEARKHRIGPLLGRPHPGSPGEQHLAAHLARDPELAGLFSFNVRVETVHGHRYLVDLLWPAGRVVVEVDGVGWHSSRSAFFADRHRDYELLISDHLVLRLPHPDVIDDVHGVIERIRDVVRFRRAQHPATRETSHGE